MLVAGGSRLEKVEFSDFQAGPEQRIENPNEQSLATGQSG